MLFHWSHSESPRTCEDPAFGPIPKVFSEVAAMQTLEIERVAKELKESIMGQRRCLAEPLAHGVGAVAVGGLRPPRTLGRDHSHAARPVGH